MSGKLENPYDRAQTDAKGAWAGQSLHDEVNQVQSQFQSSDPGDYAKYIASLQGINAVAPTKLDFNSLSPEALATSHKIDQLRVLDFGNDSIYRELDNFGENNNRKDGVIGAANVDAAIRALDSNDPSSIKGLEQQWNSQNNIKLRDVLVDMKKDIDAMDAQPKGRGGKQKYDKSHLQSALGISNPNDIEGAYNNAYTSERQALDSAPPNQMGDLHVDQQGYLIKDGDNLTQIARNALSVKQGDTDPATVQQLVNILKDRNNLQDANLIHAGQHLVVTPDMLQAASAATNPPANAPASAPAA